MSILINIIYRKCGISPVSKFTVPPKPSLGRQGELLANASEPRPPVMNLVRAVFWLILSLKTGAGVGGGRASETNEHLGAESSSRAAQVDLNFRGMA